MKKFLIIVVAVLAVVYFYSLIGSGNMDIETVKNSNTPTSPLVGAFLAGLTTEQSATIGSGISKIAGVNGTAEWETYHPDKYKDNPNIRCIQVIVKKTSDKGKKQTATFQFLLNKSSKYVELNYFEVNGKPKNKLAATMALRSGIL